MYLFITLEIKEEEKINRIHSEFKTKYKGMLHIFKVQLFLILTWQTLLNK